MAKKLRFEPREIVERYWSCATCGESEDIQISVWVAPDGEVSDILHEGYCARCDEQRAFNVHDTPPDDEPEPRSQSYRRQVEQDWAADRGV